MTLFLGLRFDDAVSRPKDLLTFWSQKLSSLSGSTAVGKYKELYATDL